MREKKKRQRMTEKEFDQAWAMRSGNKMRLDRVIFCVAVCRCLSLCLLTVRSVLSLPVRFQWALHCSSRSQSSSGSYWEFRHWVESVCTVPFAVRETRLDRHSNRK